MLAQPPDPAEALAATVAAGALTLTPDRSRAPANGGPPRPLVSPHDGGSVVVADEVDLVLDLQLIPR